MKKEDLEKLSLGLTEQQIKAITDASTEELKGYVSKAEYDGVNTAKGQLEKDLKDRDKQLEDIKKSSGDNEALQQQIATLQADNSAAKIKYEADMKALKLDTAIKLTVGNTAHDTDLVASLVDKAKLVLTDDGNVAGLEEQVKALKESKAFLFKAETTPGKDDNKPAAGYKPRAGATNEGGIGKGLAEAMNKANETADNPYANAWG